jgi:phosphate transport system substrate-binding protein
MADAYPIYEEIGADLAPSGITLNYQLSGIGPALAQFGAGRTSFVASEGTGLPALPRVGTTSALYVPVGFEAVAVVYNLPSVHRPLRLDGRTLADIFRGVIQRWNDRRIARLNPNLRLPPIPILAIHRSDPVNLTALVTAYLSAGSAAWRRTVGAGPLVEWPGGTPAPSDATMVAEVSQNLGAIGYTEQPVALKNGFQTASLRNPAGNYLGPTIPASSAVGQQTHPPGEFAVSTVNAPAPGAYPIAYELYLLVYRDPCGAGIEQVQAQALQRFLVYVLSGGQAVIDELSIGPLPIRMRLGAQAAVDRLLCGAQPISQL